jgi:hypothetical protein
VYATWLRNGRKTIPNMEQVAYITKAFDWDVSVKQFSKAIEDAITIKQKELTNVDGVVGSIKI